MTLTTRDVQCIAEATAAAMLRYASTSKPSASGQSDGVRGRGADEDGVEHDDTCRRLWPFGLRSLPPSGVDALVAYVGGQLNAVLLGAESGKYGPSDLEEGETALYCIADGCLFRLTKLGEVQLASAADQEVMVIARGAGRLSLSTEDSGPVAIAATNGNVTVDAGSGKKIKFNGGGKGAARKNHKISAGTINFVAAGSSSITSLTITYTPKGTGTPQVVTLSPSGSGTITLDEDIAEGSASIELKAD